MLTKMIVLTRHETPDKFYVEANGNSNEVLFIDRLTQEVGLDSSLQGVPASARTRPINGIIGIIHLPAGHYLVVITKVNPCLLLLLSYCHLAFLPSSI